MKKISILLIIALLLNITFSVTIFAKNEVTEELQLNNFINYAEEDGVLPSGWSNNDNNNENTMLKMADSENDGEKCLSFDCTSKTGRINGKNFTNQTSGKLLFESRVFFTKKSGLSLSFTGTSDAVRPGVTLYQDGLDDGQWHDMRIVIDITNGTISMGYDGEEPVVKVQNITFSYGVQRFYFANWSTTNSVVSFQKLDVYKYYTEAMPVKFDGKTVLNESVDFEDGDVVKSGINTLNITFDANLASVGADMVSLLIKDGENYDTISTALTFSDKTVTLTCEPLLAGEEYKIVIGEGIVTTSNLTSTATYEISFFTDEGNIVAELDKNIQGGIIESYITIYDNDFESEADFSVVSGEMGVAKGLTAIRTNDADTSAGYLTISPSARGITAFGLSYGTYINAGDFVRVSFDYKAPNLDASPEIQIYADAEDLSTGLKFADYCEGDAFVADEWQTYHIEIYPSTSTSEHSFKLYRGDNGDAVETSTYSVDGTNTTGLRVRFTQRKTGEENYQYFDNIKVERKKTYIAENFTDSPEYITAGNLYKSGLINTGNMTIADGVLKGNGSEIAGAELIHAGLASEVNGTTTEVYFRAKMPNADKVSVVIGNDEYSLSDDSVFGGDTFSADTWQKYHIVLSDDKAMLWRGEATQYEAATENTFNSSVIEAVVKMISNAGGDIIELDDFSWTIYEEGKEPVKTELPNSVTAKIKNTTAKPYKAYIIYSEYSSANEMLGTQYKFIDVPANDEKSFDMNFTAPNGDEVAKAYAYLWKLGTSVPMSEMVIVK